MFLSFFLSVYLSIYLLFISCMLLVFYLNLAINFKKTTFRSSVIKLCLFASVSVCLSLRLSVCLSLHLSVCLSLRLSVCYLFVHLSVYLFVYLSVISSSICLFISSSICLCPLLSFTFLPSFQSLLKLLIGTFGSLFWSQPINLRIVTQLGIVRDLSETLEHFGTTRNISEQLWIT